MNIYKKILILPVLAAVIPLSIYAKDSSHTTHGEVPDKVVEQQRSSLAKNTNNMGFGPQSPRDIDMKGGQNSRAFGNAPAYQEMNLCNIHFHKNAEHKGGEFTLYAGNGDGKGYQSGYKFSGRLSKAEATLSQEVCPSKHGGLNAGDTIEVHYVHSSAQVKPGPTLGSCLRKLSRTLSYVLKRRYMYS